MASNNKKMKISIPQTTFRIYSILVNLWCKSIDFRLSTYTFIGKNDVRYFEGRRMLLVFPTFSPSNLYLDKALAAMEGTEAANVLLLDGAITPTLLQLQLRRSHCF
jgi:hypothetical protein